MVGGCSKTGPSPRVLHKNHKTRLAVATRLPPRAQKGINSTVRSSFKRLKGNTVGEIPDEEDGRWCSAARGSTVRCAGAVAPAGRRLRRPRRWPELDLQQLVQQHSHDAVRQPWLVPDECLVEHRLRPGWPARLRLRRPAHRVGRRLPREQRHPGVRRHRRHRWHQPPADQRDGQLLLRLHGRWGVRSLRRRRRRCRVPQSGRSRQRGEQHAVRLPGDGRRGLQHQRGLPCQPGRPLHGHDHAQLHAHEPGRVRNQPPARRTTTSARW